MKAIKYALLLLVIAVSFSSCVIRSREYVVREHRVWIPGHYEYGPYQSRRWIGGHYRY